MTIRELFVYLGFDVDTSGAEKMEKSVENVKKRQESMVSSFIKGQMIYDAGKKVISGAFNFVKDSVIGAEAEVERYRVVLGTMIGDQEKANAIIHDLDWNSGLSDYYGTANAVGGLQSLVTYGLQAEEAADALKRIGDVAQGDSEAFNSMAQNLGQVFATGKASAMDLKQFANRGFDVVGELARIEGKSREEIEKAGVGYKEVKKALDSLTSAGGKYEGMLEKQKNTLGGVLKRIEAFKVGVAENIGHAINEPLKELLVTILEIADKGKEAFIDKFAGALKVVIHWIHQIVISFELIKMRLAESGSQFNGLKAVAKSVFGTIAKNIERLIPIITNIIYIIITVADTLGTLLAPIAAIILDNQSLISLISTIISLVDKFLPLIGGLTAGILTLVAAAKGMAIIKKITDMGSAGMPAWAKATKIGTAVQATMNAVMALNPVFWIVAGVVALIAALIILYKKCEPFRKFVDNLWESIKAFFAWFIEGAKNTIDSIVSFFKGLIDTIKSIFEAIRDFFSAFWEAVKAAPIAFVDFIAGIFHAVVDTIKTIFEAVKNFFVSFWEALKAGPQALADFITGIFTNMFDGIRQKLFGFIDSVKEGWAKVKGIVGGAWDTAVNFVTGGKDKGKGSAKDKALTKSVETAVGNTSTYYGAQSSSNTINAPTTMNISVPQGTSAEQSQAIAEQVKYAYNNQLAYAINSSRSNIPSPERRRY